METDKGVVGQGSGWVEGKNNRRAYRMSRVTGGVEEEEGGRLTISPTPNSTAVLPTAGNKDFRRDINS